MLGVAAGVALFVGCSVIVGQGVARLARYPGPAWWAPGVGACLLLALGGLLIRAPGRGLTVVAACAVATVLALLSRDVRAAVWRLVPDGLPVALGGGALAMLPFAVSGRVGLIGVGINNDMSAHLTTAWWLEHRVGPQGVGALGGGLPDSGYPLGPHAIADALVRVFHGSLVHAFDAVILAPVPLVGLVALGALSGLRRPLRIAAALLVSVAYLLASYVVQSAFKEAFEALVLITAVIATADLLARAPGWRAGIPLGVVLAGAVHIYSYPGLAWPVGAIGLVALLHVKRRRAPAALVGLVAAAGVLILPAIPQIVDFYRSPFSGENLSGNLFHAISPLEGLNVWLRPDFRFYPDPLWPTVALAGVSLVALVLATARLLAAREWALPAGLFVGVVLWGYTAATKSIYVAAKALAVVAPVVALVTAVGLLAASDRRRPRAALSVLALVTGLAMAASSFLALRDARIGPLGYGTELAQFLPRLAHHRTLYLPRDDFAQWNLRGANIAVPRRFYAPAVAPIRPSKPSAPDDQIDFDNFTAETLDHYKFVITGSAPYQSAAPPNFHVVARTPSFLLWERTGHTPVRYPFERDGVTSGAVADCRRAADRQRLALAGPNGTAGVRPRPIVRQGTDWAGQPRTAGQAGRLGVRLPRGTWDVSLQYVSNTGLDVTAGPLTRALPPTLGRLSTYYFVGTVRVGADSVVTVTGRAQRMNAFARLLGAPGMTRAQGIPLNLPLGDIAFTRHGARERVVPVRRACGRYVDWIAPAAPAGT